MEDGCHLLTGHSFKFYLLARKSSQHLSRCYVLPSIGSSLIKKHPTDKPWITPELKTLIQQRQQAMFKDAPEFKKIRNKVNRLNNSLRSSFFESKVKNCDNATSWWKSIKQLAGFQRRKTLTSAIVSDKEIHSTELATHINQSFLSVTQSLPPLSPLENVETDFAAVNEILSKYYISPESVYVKLSNLKRGKASGPDNLPSWILKDFAMELSSPVAEIFNYASILERIVPDSWKEADVIPIPKSVSVKEIENDLRPISLTPIISRTMEHFVAEWIMSQIRHHADRKKFGSLAGLSIYNPRPTVICSSSI